MTTKMILLCRFGMVAGGLFLTHACGTESPSFKELPKGAHQLSQQNSNQSADAINGGGSMNAGAQGDTTVFGGSVVRSTVNGEAATAQDLTTPNSNTPDGLGIDKDTSEGLATDTNTPDNGNAPDNGGSDSVVIPPRVPRPGTTPIAGVDPLNSLLWYWPCSAQPEAPPVAPSSVDPVIVGPGPFSLDSHRMGETQVTLQGQLCKPAQLKRDIVFVIDVSGSMASPYNHDPKKSDSCGRLAALQTVLGRFAQNGLTRFALLTFNDKVKMTTGTFSTSAANLTSNVLAITGAAKLADVVCAGYGSTNYDDALNGTAQILQSSIDPSTSKEIYFISDGEPDPARYDGIAIADSLKEHGVTIATLMLIGDDEGLKKIASVDQTDPTQTRLLHMKVNAADQLADTLSALAQNYLVGGTIKYRVIGADSWVSFDLLAIAQNFHFQLPAFPTDETLAPDGIEVSLDYWDKRGTHLRSIGQLLWFP